MTARRITTSRDVARLAGVSQSSVSRAFSPGAPLSPELRTRILNAAEQLNYIPNSLAGSLSRARSNTIALIIGDTENPFYIHVLRAFLKALAARGQQVLTFMVPPGATSDDAIRQVLEFRVDGIILTSAQVSTRMVSLCQERGIPIILFNRYIPGTSLPVVRCDNFGGGQIMADVLLGAGARSFALLRGDPLGTTSQDRVNGFLSRIGPLPVRIIEGGSSYDLALESFSKLHAPGDRLPDAVFAVNDVMAMAVIDVLRHRLGRNIPEDVMVAGFDDIPESRRLPYRLTTLFQPIAEMVQEALALLDRQMARKVDEDTPPDLLVPSRLIWRETVRGEAPIPPPPIPPLLPAGNRS